MINCHEVFSVHDFQKRQEFPLSSPLATIDLPAAERHQGLAIVLAISLLLRLAACWYWSDDLAVDRDAYLGIARNIAAGKGFCSPETSSPTSFRPPVFPILIGVFQLAIPESLAVAAINIFAGLATVGATWVLVKSWWQLSCGKQVAATLAIAADPLLLRYTAQPMTECVFTALTAWTMVGVTRLWIDPHGPRRMALGTGALAGLAVLCRPTLYPFVGLVWLGLLFVAPRFNVEGLRSRVRQVSFYSFAIMGVVALWVGRNAIVIHEPLLTTTHGGYTLLLGNNPVFYREVARQPWGTVWQHDSLIRWQESIAAAMQQDLGDRVSEVAADRWHSRRAWQAIDADPTGFHAAVLYRLRSFWSLAPRASEMNGRRLSALIACWYAVLFVLAAIGFFKAVWQRRPSVWIGGLLIATVMALHLLYWTDTRMRAPLHPVLVAFAVGAGAMKWPRQLGFCKAASG